MGRGKSGHQGCCPKCKGSSDSVHHYSYRKLKHFAIGGMECRIYPAVSFRCLNGECSQKTFTVLLENEGIEEVVGRSRYTASSKNFVSTKMLKRQVSYNSFHSQLKEDFGASTSLSSLHKWTREKPTMDVHASIPKIEVLHTDEKHPSKKKKKR
jgi:hypothetical protein